MKVNLEGLTSDDIEKMSRDDVIGKCMEDWLGKPTTKMCLKMLDTIETPAGRREVVDNLLKDCFEVAAQFGFECGQDMTRKEVLEKLIRPLLEKKTNGAHVQPGPAGQA